MLSSKQKGQTLTWTVGEMDSSPTCRSVVFFSTLLLCSALRSRFGSASLRSCTEGASSLPCLLVTCWAWKKFPVLLAPWIVTVMMVAMRS